MPTTVWPCSSSNSATLAPMKPAHPVTKTFIANPFSSSSLERAVYVKSRLAYALLSHDQMFGTYASSAKTLPRELPSRSRSIWAECHHLALHVAGNRHVQKLQNCRGDVHQLQIEALETVDRTLAIMHYENAMRCMIGVVRTGVVLEGMNLAGADAAD